MPHLAQLLHHKNAAICEQAARAMIETAKLDKNRFEEQTSETMILKLRQWWEDNGINEDWAKD
jgi:hypothetical protein